MKILILGATGMIGHTLWMGLSDNHSVSALIRKSRDDLSTFSNIEQLNIIDQVDVLDLDLLEEILVDVKPDIVFNCVGIVKQLSLSQDHIHSIELNSLFPHKLAKLCRKEGARMIQFSSDCIFDGQKGMYVESDYPNASDLYGKSKAMGEIDYLDNVLTLRTSFIGRELFPHGGLINWLESQHGKVIKGFSNAIYSGLPTQTFIHILNDYIFRKPKLNGLYHLSSQPIDKYSLLIMAKDTLGLQVEIDKDTNFEINRSLDSSKFTNDFGYSAPVWGELIKDLGIRSEFYKKLSGIT